jgi:hypothetical protein
MLIELVPLSRRRAGGLISAEQLIPRPLEPPAGFGFVCEPRPPPASPEGLPTERFCRRLQQRLSPPRFCVCRVCVCRFYRRCRLPKRARPQRSAGTRPAPAREKPSVFECCFPHVCPEPVVLVKRSFLIHKWLKETGFAHRDGLHLR